MDTKFKKAVAFMACAATFASFAAQMDGEDYQEALAKRAPRNMKLMIAGFGTIEAMTQVDKWLGEQLLPQQNLDRPPTLSDADKIKNPDLDREIVRFNWNSRKMEYIKNQTEIDEENARNKRLLDNLRTKTLANDATRYVPLAKDYLQAAISRRAGKLVQVVDRTNADMALVEQALSGNDASAFAGAGCILTATLGDREEDFREYNVNARIKRRETVYTQPYTFKVRDLEGNVLIADSGSAVWKDVANSTVKSVTSDPARKLVEQACEQIAERIVAFFTAELNFVVKAPKGLDEDEAEVSLDGRSIDIDGRVRVLAVEHFVTAELDGCKPIRRLLDLQNEDGKVRVKLVFKKREPVVVEATVDDDDDEEVSSPAAPTAPVVPAVESGAEEY